MNFKGKLYVVLLSYVVGDFKIWQTHKMSTLKHFVLNVNTCCLIYIYIFCCRGFKIHCTFSLQRLFIVHIVNVFNVISLYIVYLLLQILDCDVHCLYVLDILVHFLMIAMHIYVCRLLTSYIMNSLS
jgi:hypothetical protein